MTNQTIELGVAYLEKRGVLRETFEAHGGEIRGVTPDDRDLIADRLNWDENTRRSQGKIGWAETALHFPIFGADGTSEPQSWIIRLLAEPGISPPPGEPKYRVPTGKRSPVWIPQITREAAKDVSKPFIITEGMVKGEVIAQAGGRPIACMGVWGVAEPIKKPKRKDIKDGFVVMRQELSGWEWMRRKVYLGFDADWKVNSKVRQAAIRTAFILFAQGAEVYQLTSWELSESKGIDDYLATKARLDLEEQKQVLAGLMTGARPFFEGLEIYDLKLAMRELHRVKMSWAEFNQLIRRIAKPLKVPVEVLASGRPHREIQEDKQDGGGKKISFPPIEPWKIPIDGKALLKELSDFIQKHIYCTEDQSLIISVWSLWTYLVQENFVEVSPYLGITAADKRCGKSRLLDLIERLVPRGYLSSDISSSSFFRLVEMFHPTLLVDEFHRLVERRPEVLDIYIRAFDRNRHVLRTNLDTMQPEEFDIWGARAIAYLRKLDEQLYDRVIEIYLKRKPAGEKRARLSQTPRSVTQELQSKCLRWVRDNLEKIQAVHLPDLGCVSDRAADSWRLLFAIAYVIDPKVEKHLRAVALKIEAEDRDDDALMTAVLTGLRDVFARKCDALGQNFADPKTDLRLPLTSLCAELNQDKLAEWSEWQTKSGEIGMTERKLSSLLREHRIKPERKRIDTNPNLLKRQQSAVNTYSLKQLRPIFETHL